MSETPTLTDEQQAAVQAEIQRVAGGIREEARAQGARDRESEIRTYLEGEAEAQRIAALQGEEQLREQLASAEAARQAAEARVARTEADAAARAALLAADFAPATIEDALRLLGDGDLAETVPALAERLPALLSTTGDGAAPPPGIPPAKQKKATGGKTAAERARDRFTSTQTPLAKTA